MLTVLVLEASGVARLVWKLRGIPCHPLETSERPRKKLCRSRSFSLPVTTIADSGKALAMHHVCGGEKLRRQRLAASHMTVFVSTSRFRPKSDELYSMAASWRLLSPLLHAVAD